MKSDESFQNQLIGAFIAITFLVSIAYGLFVFNAMKYTEDDILNRRLELEAQNFIDHYLIDNQALLPSSIGFQSYLSSSPDIPNWLIAQPMGIRELHEQELHIGVFAIPNREQKLYLVLSELEASNLENEISSLVIILIAVGVVTTLIGLLVGLKLSQWIALPISKLTADVQSSNSQASLPFYGAERSDEIGALSRSFGELVNQLNQFLLRERDFTRYASHELRTPISLIKNSLALLKLDKNLEATSNKSVTRIESATIELESLVDTFLILARDPSAIEDSEFNVIEIIQNNLARNEWVNKTKKLTVELQVNFPLQLQSKQKLFDIAIDNIIRNIYQHGGEEAMITIEQNEIKFTNSIPPDFIEQPGERFGEKIINQLIQSCNLSVQHSLIEGVYTTTIRL